MYTQSYKSATDWLSWKGHLKPQVRNTVDVKLAAVIFGYIFNSQICLDRRTTLSV
jgi:hypothetical protein